MESYPESQSESDNGESGVHNESSSELEDPKSESRDPSSDTSEQSDPSEMSDPSSEIGEQGESQTGEKIGDCGGVASCGMEKFLQAMMRALSSKMLIRFSGHGSKIMDRMSFRSSERGSIVFKKPRFLVKAV